MHKAEHCSCLIIYRARRRNANQLTKQKILQFIISSEYRARRRYANQLTKQKILQFIISAEFGSSMIFVCVLRNKNIKHTRYVIVSDMVCPVFFPWCSVLVAVYSRLLSFCSPDTVYLQVFTYYLIILNYSFT